jgi:hypothetical protein
MCRYPSEALRLVGHDLEIPDFRKFIKVKKSVKLTLGGS